MDLVAIHEAEVSGLVHIDGVNLHVRGLGEGGCFSPINHPKKART